MTGIATKSNLIILIGGSAATGITAAEWATQNKDLVAISVGVATVAILAVNTLWKIWKDWREINNRPHNRRHDDEP